MIGPENRYAKVCSRTHYGSVSVHNALQYTVTIPLLAALLMQQALHFVTAHKYWNVFEHSFLHYPTHSNINTAVMDGMKEMAQVFNAAAHDDNLFHQLILRANTHSRPALKVHALLLRA
jgi:hypothetical protein